MPLAVQRRYVVLHDGAVAAAALRCEHIEVVLPAVRLAVPLVEALLAELLAALGAEEVLRVPGLLQGGHAFLKIAWYRLPDTWQRSGGPGSGRSYV